MKARLKNTAVMETMVLAGSEVEITRRNDECAWFVVVVPVRVTGCFPWSEIDVLDDDEWVAVRPSRHLPTETK